MCRCEEWICQELQLAGTIREVGSWTVLEDGTSLTHGVFTLRIKQNFPIDENLNIGMNASVQKDPQIINEIIAYVEYLLNGFVNL